MTYQQAKEKYPMVKALHEAAIDADRKDGLAQLARSSLTPTNMEAMQRFLKQCEDYGIQTVVRSVN